MLRIERMWVWSCWALWWLLLGSSVVWVLIGAVSFWLTRGMVPGSVPDWVQALGSILAVASGFVLAFVQNHQTEKAARRERHLKLKDVINSKNDYLEKAVYVAGNAAASCGRLVNIQIDNPSFKPAQFQVLLDMIQRATVELECINIVELATPRTVDAWFGFKRDLYIFQVWASKFVEEGSPSSGQALSVQLNALMLSLESFNKAVLDFRDQNTRASGNV